MDTRMLEVVMGLVLVLALVSLLAAVMNEAFVAWKGRRGDVLTLALCSLLGENDVTEVRRSKRSGNVGPFSNGLLTHPLLASQVRGNVKDPVKGEAASYLDSRVFVSALLAYGNERAGPGSARPTDPASWVRLMAQPSAHQPQPRKALVDALQSLLGGVEQDWPAFERRLCAWYDSVMDRASGWFQRNTQFRLFWLGALIAALGNINPLVIGDRLWNDPLVRAAFTDGATLATELSAPAAASQPASAPAAPKANAKAASTKPPAADTPLGAIVDRSLQQLRDDVLRLGEERATAAGGEAAAKVAEVRRVIQRFDNLRDDVQRRRQAWRDGASTDALLQHSLALEDEYEALCLGVMADETFAADERVARIRNLLKYERNQQLRQSVPAADSLCRQAQGGALEAACKRLEGSDRIGLGQLPVGWSFANLPGCDAACQQRVRVAKAGQLQQRVLEDSMEDARALRRDLHAGQASQESWPWRAHVGKLTRLDWGVALAYSVMGFALIGIGSMLGAPFWFDLLSKVAKLRAAGLAAKAASEAAETPTAAAAGATPTATDAGGVLARGAAATAPAGSPPAAGPARRAGRVPLYTNNDIHVLSEQQVRDLYGDIRTTGAGGVVTLTNPGVGAVKRTLVTLSHPLLKGRTVEVHERARAHFEAAFDAIEAAGLSHLILTCEGTVSLRHIGHDPNKPLSHHCWGIAIDFNQAANGYGAVPAAVGQPGSVRELVPIFNRYGFAWGGHFRDKADGMHFELALLDPTQPPQPLADA
jgi:type II secretory pathway pseudopilin PulG